MKYSTIFKGAQGLTLAFSLVATAAFAQDQTVGTAVQSATTAHVRTVAPVEADQSADTATPADEEIQAAEEAQAVGETQSAAIGHVRTIAQVETDQSAGATDATTPPVADTALAQDVLAWQFAMKDRPSSEEGCFTASYPDTQWQQVPCTPPENPVPYVTPPPPPHSGSDITRSTIGNSYSDRIAFANGGKISSAEGSFPNVLGVTSVVSGGGASGSLNNSFTLQLNTNLWFDASSSGLCGNVKCQGWQQFIYAYSNGAAEVYVQYWLYGLTTCPSGTVAPNGTLWAPFGNMCYGNGPSNKNIPSPPGITGLGSMRLTGRTSGGYDYVTFYNGSQAFPVPAYASPFKNSLAQGWTSAEFNVFGYHGTYPMLTFNSGSTLTVKTTVINGTSNTPNCNGGSTTGEMNNLNFVGACFPSGGAAPSITFVESNATGPYWGSTSCPQSSEVDAYTMSSEFIYLGWLCLQSTNGLYRAYFQGDGNFMLYKKDPNTQQYTHVLWQSQTYGKGASYLSIQSDLNFVIYTSSGTALWSTGSYLSRLPAGTFSTRMIMQNDGNLVVYSADASGNLTKAIWASGTAGQ
ncbi:MAG: hypothetical protein LBQ20_10055 [Rhodanobacter sp.]|nr:hypothetical protein [Rhodanobacter sp.]